jgi:hypothetical protein
MVGSVADQSGTPGKDPDRAWAKSVGTVAAPLLAGFSFTAVISLSVDADKFRFAGLAILSLTIAVITLIAAVQCSKYAGKKGHPSWWLGLMRLFSHGGIVVLLLGLGFALAPQDGTGSQGTLRWEASYAAYGACILEFAFFIWDAWRKRQPASSQ